MSFVNKIKDLFSPSEYTDDMYDDENVNGPVENERDIQNEEITQTPVAAPKNVSYGSSLELKVVRPDSFDKVTSIADHLLAKKTVVLNLEDTNKEAARRLLDFLSGAAYAINGTLKRVSNSTFIITPNNVSVSGEQLQDIAESEKAEGTSQLF